jgi:hypothetical protein
MKQMKIKKKQLMKIKNEENKIKENKTEIIELFGEDDNSSIDPDTFEIKQSTNTLNELDDPDEIIDNRDIIEYERDMVNNNIVNRLNSDIDIRKFRETSQKKEFMMPYSDTSIGHYAPFNSKQKISTSDFSNKKIKKEPI